MQAKETIVEINWELVSSHLICPLCEGLYRDAHTISECLHTFCKSCLMNEFYNKSVRGSISCPTCQTPLGHIQNAYTKTVHDRNLQSIVDKLFPNFAKQEREYKLQLIDSYAKKRKLHSDAHLSNSAKKPPTVSTTTATSSTLEYTYTISPDKVCAEEQVLPSLARPQFKGTLALKVAKIVSFVVKRIADSVPSIDKEDIEILYNNLVLNVEHDLKISIGHLIPPDTLDLNLNYRRKAK